jgi:hypothetical protein
MQCGIHVKKHNSSFYVVKSNKRKSSRIDLTNHLATFEGLKVIFYESTKKNFYCAMNAIAQQHNYSVKQIKKLSRA